MPIWGGVSVTPGGDPDSRYYGIDDDTSTGPGTSSMDILEAANRAVAHLETVIAEAERTGHGDPLEVFKALVGYGVNHRYPKNGCGWSIWCYWLGCLADCQRLMDRVRTDGLESVRFLIPVNGDRPWNYIKRVVSAAEARARLEWALLLTPA